MGYKNLPSAERAKHLTDVVTRMIQPMAEQIAMLRGATPPEFVVSRVDSERKLHLSGEGQDLYDAMRGIDEHLEMGYEPVGYIYDSITGVVYQPFNSEDESQTSLLHEYERRQIARRNE